ncbi:phosphoribosylamine--glycine ligase [Pyrodictium occultum]|uniref:phosphoribosylamine--glycine ligase n=1 Tax=Pyrodictium occultum TaxID=2309 RepID=A0A0V8RVN6_PYROC|nr:phosphoribosylamine--glycine ligase [Pyrodictium occultum]KSW12111.1 phosphoribosylamine--glycine ligase [Pyrodictium occultum]
MKVLLVGSGGREHALAVLMARSGLEPRIAVVSDKRNPGLAEAAERTGGRLYTGKPTSPADVARTAEEWSPDLVVIGPEEPLFAGVADALRERGFTVYGPGAAQARIEKDKAYARELMWRHRIPGRLRYRVFTDPREAAEYARAAGDVAVKPARQAGGRGVRVFAEPMEHLGSAVREAAAGYAERLAERIRESYSDIEHAVIVEERVEGVEYTVMAVTDGSTVVPLPAIQDHPHLFTWDLGPETGGMGAVSGPGTTPSFLEPGEYRETVEILEKTVEAIRADTGEPYRGTLSGQMMLTSLWGPTVIEYYARFGDPETANLVHMVESDFLELLDRAASGRLAGYRLEVAEDTYVVTIALAPAGYPNNRSIARGHPVAVDRGAVEREGCSLLYAGVDEGPGGLVSTGSRLVEIACPSTRGYEDAAARAQRAASAVRLLDGHPLVWRRDIGSRSHIEARVRLAERVRKAYLRRRERGETRVYDWIPGRGLLVYDYG